MMLTRHWSRPLLYACTVSSRDVVRGQEDATAGRSYSRLTLVIHTSDVRQKNQFIMIIMMIFEMPKPLQKSENLFKEFQLK